MWLAQSPTNFTSVKDIYGIPNNNVDYDTISNLN